MILCISQVLVPFFSFFNIVHYISFRSMAALLTSLFFSLFLGYRFIRFAKKYFRSASREFTPDGHRKKDGMPTMGGVFVVGIVVITLLLWADLSNAYIWIFLGCISCFTVLGAIDDIRKIHFKKGITSGKKFLAQSVIALLTSLALYFAGLSTVVSFPFFKWMNIDLGWFFIFWPTFIIVAMSNAVNLTDGLDGLAINSLIPNFFTFCVICYLAGHAGIAHYLHIPFAPSAEVTVIGAALAGASLGFLWFNAYPAEIFMGDVGSLALGAALAFMGIMCKQELLLPLAGGLFLIETLSVIIQVASFRRFGKRVFRMAPLHHHFELLGWPEAKISVRFSIISLILCIFSLMTLKIR